MKIKLFAAVLLTVCPLGAAHAMDVATFLAKADALEKKGMMALFSSDYKVLKAEAEAAGSQLRAERAAAQKAGRKAAYCPPAKSELGAKELLGYLRTIPAARRPRMQLKDGLRGLLARKYPCR
ncbi:MAG TPA: hypothetical protein VGC35_04070 [Allosphingosinicella sp.]